MLEPFYDVGHSTALRVLLLTDGCNNVGRRPQEVLAKALRLGAVVDVIAVGQAPESSLLKIVAATGGESYLITDLREGFDLLEAESVVSVRERISTARAAYACKFESIAEKPVVRAADLTCKMGLDPQLSAMPVVDVGSFSDIRALRASEKTPSQKRIMEELHKIAVGDASMWAHSAEGVHIFPAPGHVNFWRVLLDGPADSPFSGGVFVLNMVAPDTYPSSPPQLSFETPIYHSNVSSSGKICLDLLQDKWSPALSISRCLEAVRALLKKPDPENALRQWIAELSLAYYSSGGTDQRYWVEALACTQRNAATPVAEWKSRWGVQNASNLPGDSLTVTGPTGTSDALPTRAGVVGSQTLSVFGRSFFAHCMTAGSRQGHV